MIRPGSVEIASTATRTGRNRRLVASPIRSSTGHPATESIKSIEIITSIAIKADLWRAKSDGGSRAGNVKGWTPIRENQSSSDWNENRPEK